MFFFISSSCARANADFIYSVLHSTSFGFIFTLSFNPLHKISIYIIMLLNQALIIVTNFCNGVQIARPNHNISPFYGTASEA